MMGYKSVFTKVFATLICCFLISVSGYSQTYKYPASYDAPMKLFEKGVGYGESGIGSYSYYNYSLLRKSKTFYVHHHGETMIMTDSLYDLSIGMNPWANKLFNRSLAVGEFGYGSFTVAGASLLTMFLVSGFATKFNLNMNNRFGEVFFITTGGVTLTGGVIGLISYGINRLYRNKCIKVYNAGYTSPRWSFGDY